MADFVHEVIDAVDLVDVRRAGEGDVVVEQAVVR